MNSSRDDLVELPDHVWRRVRRRMEGLTDEEYLWEPVPGCRTVRPVGDGRYRSDGPAAPGDPRVITTPAWRRRQGAPSPLGPSPLGPAPVRRVPDGRPPASGTFGGGAARHA